MSQALILIVEDEPDISNIIATYLERTGFRTSRAEDGELALLHVQSLKPDLILLDVNIPKRDGVEGLRKIRQTSDTPVIMVTAMAEDIERISALRLGADDYVVKPFNPLELVERVKAVLRRLNGSAASARAVHVGPLEIDPGSHAVFICAGENRTPINLTNTEYMLIEHMARAPQRAYARSELVDACMPESDALERTVDSHISNARRKLEHAGALGFLQTVRGVGYRLEPLS